MTQKQEAKLYYFIGAWGFVLIAFITEEYYVIFAGVFLLALNLIIGDDK